MVERAINGRDREVAVLGNVKPEAGVPGEILPANEFYVSEAKYVNAALELLIPAAMNGEALKKIKVLAIKVYKLLDCSGMSRVDFLVERETSEIYLNEVNTILGFIKISMYPKM